MTKRQRERLCDTYLCAAKHWQNENIASGNPGMKGKRYEDVSQIIESAELRDGLYGWLIWASTALSEAAALGFDLETVR